MEESKRFWRAGTNIYSREYEIVSKIVTCSILVATATIMLDPVPSFVEQN